MSPWRRTRLVGVALAVALAVGTGGTSAVASSASTTEPDDAAQGAAVAYPGDPDLEAAIVAQEDRRLLEIRTVASLARWSDLRLFDPYRMATGSTYTLILTERREPYTVEDLLALSPQTFVRQPDGAYLLSENLLVSSGATLNLTSAGRLVIRMASDQDGFVSIVNDGGRLVVSGTEASPVVMTSWDRTSGSPDVLTDDGRAYIRSTGGQSQLTHVDLAELGFWSGRTGGLALTGTDRPNTGALEDLGQAMAQDPAVMALATPRAEDGAAGEQARNVLGGLRSDQVLPAGVLPLPELDLDDPQYSYVSASLDHVTTTGNAFGLFVASANGVDVTDSRFADSLVDGLVMHRYVTNAVVEGSAATGSGGDGFVLSRATTGIVLSEVEASRNARNGISMSGLPLAGGPSATGVAVGSYGNNSVSNSSVVDNGRYGIEVVGGSNVGLQANDVAGGDMGIVVREAADDVSVVGNQVTDADRQGIAIRDGVTAAVVTGNTVEGGGTSVYVRDSEVRLERNILGGADVHAVTLVGSLPEVVVTDNVLSGRGPSAVDLQRADDLVPSAVDNDTGGWNDTTPWLVTLKKFLQPLTLLWLLLGLLVLVTALRGWRRPRRFQHPYADKAAVSDSGTAVHHVPAPRSEPPDDVVPAERDGGRDDGVAVLVGPSRSENHWPPGHLDVGFPDLPPRRSSGSHLAASPSREIDLR